MRFHALGTFADSDHSEQRLPPLRSVPSFGHTMKLPSITRVSRITCFEDSALPGQFAEVVIFSSSRKFSVRCDPELDEVVISTVRRKRRGRGSCLVSGKYRVEWMWALKNQQGYDDGFRIQLASDTERRVFDIIAIASRLEIREASPWPNLRGRASGRQPSNWAPSRTSAATASRRSP